MQGCVNVTSLTLKGLCVHACGATYYILATDNIYIFNNIGFQMCPQIKAKNYDKVEKVSICYRMEATFWIYWSYEIVFDTHIGVRP